MVNNVCIILMDQSLKGKQIFFVYHASVDSLTTLLKSWQHELKNRLLLSSEAGACEAEQTAVSTCTVGAGDFPNFDEDTDSLDTLSISLDGIESGVVEAVQYLIDCVVEEEESELDNQQQLESALANAPPEGGHVLFRADEESEAETSTTPGTTPRPRHESGERPMPIGDSVARLELEALSRQIAANIFAGQSCASSLQLA
ncbi:unnamed protein product [Strongylus vulgaris]|uniref:Uncharacterized protein n=1 Tax=Strongylus vulgaris TaxID=40348 RepID=A0A3P7L1K2_STRVU|nr:unnamed protein product [Strongylus vulgaris]